MRQPVQAHDPLQGAQTDALPSRTAEASMRRALNAHRDGWEVDDHLRAAGRMIADDARRVGLSAEKMLVGLKAAWMGLQETRTLPRGEDRDLLERLVTCTIRAYYDGQPPRPASDPSAG